MKFSTNEDIEAPVEAVFDMFCDFESFERSAMRRGAEVQRVDDLVKPGVGMTWRAAFRMRGKPRQIELEMVTFDRPNEIALASISSGMVGAMGFQMIALARQRTRVRAELELKPLNISSRLLIQSLRLAKKSLNQKFKWHVADYARGMEDRYRGVR